MFLYFIFASNQSEVPSPPRTDSDSDFVMVEHEGCAQEVLQPKPEIPPQKDMPIESPETVEDHEKVVTPLIASVSIPEEANQSVVPQENETEYPLMVIKPCLHPMRANMLRQADWLQKRRIGGFGVGSALIMHYLPLTF